jgi:hypothetical protein
MILDTIVSSPIIFPKIVPDDWDRWSKLWNDEATIGAKVIKNHNDTGVFWRGINVYVKLGIDSTEYTRYKIKNVICPEMFPSLFDNLDSFPFDIDVMQIVSSIHPVQPHHDHIKAKLSIRSMLYDDNPKPTYYYDINGVNTYQLLPDDTNTWVYHDNRYKHGTDYYYGHTKQLIIFYGTVKRDILESNLTSSIDRYKDYIIRDTNALSSNT